MSKPTTPDWAGSSRAELKPHIVGNQIQTLKLLIGVLANPAVFRPQLGGIALQAGQSYPLLLPTGVMADFLTEQTPVRKVVIPQYQCVPATTLGTIEGASHPHLPRLHAAGFSGRRNFCRLAVRNRSIYQVDNRMSSLSTISAASVAVFASK